MADLNKLVDELSSLTVIEAAVRRDGNVAIVDRALQLHTELTPLWQAHTRNKGRYGSPRAVHIAISFDRKGVMQQVDHISEIPY